MANKPKESTARISDHLLYRNQFILGPRFADEFPSWEQISVSDDLCLTIHPALNHAHIVDGDLSITLLGYILDPCNPHHSDADILHSLLAESRDQSRFLECTYQFGGRWILLVHDQHRAWMMHDATGLRQICYTDRQQSKDMWCASQPGLLALLLNFAVDEEADDFLNSEDIRKLGEFMWPAESTAYREVIHLLPNHYLDLGTGLARRYWPMEPLDKLSLGKAVKRISATLRGLMAAANNRYDLALGLTAGLDSRLVLAASRDICNEMRFVSVRQKHLSDDYADLTIPAELLSKLGLRHEIIDGSIEPDKEFLQIFRNNVPFAHEDAYASDACAIRAFNDNRLVAVTGSASEVARAYLRLPRSEMNGISAERIAQLEGMGSHPFAVKAFQRWLSGITDCHGIHLLDLLTWEVGSGNWLSTTQLEFDIAWRDIFTPYNCRRLLADMLSVREFYRSEPAYKLYMELISNLWPDVLSVPVNPQYNTEQKFSLLRAVRRYVALRLR